MNMSNANKLKRHLAPTRIIWFTLAAGFFAACIIAITLMMLESQGRKNIDRLTQNSANSIAVILEENLQTRMLALKQFASLSQFKSTMTDDEWESISKVLYASNGGYQAVG